MDFSGWRNKSRYSPAVARNSDGRMQVFIVGTNNQLYYKTQSSPNSNTWSSAWTSLGGGLRDNNDPAVVPNANSSLDAFVVAPRSTGPANPPPTHTNFPYSFVGSPQDMEDEGWDTRHYASGKPDDITHEWSGETSAQNYAIIIDITITEIDHDDQIGFKFGGTHMGSGCRTIHTHLNQVRPVLEKKKIIHQLIYVLLLEKVSVILSILLLN